MRVYQYPAEFTPAEEGGFVVTFPDLPEAITQGETIEECIEEAALYEEIHRQGMTKVELAARLGIDKKEVRRLLDPYHATKAPRIAEILERVGKRVVYRLQKTARCWSSLRP